MLTLCAQLGGLRFLMQVVCACVCWLTLAHTDLKGDDVRSKIAAANSQRHHKAVEEEE
jgi:hypothetical protein